MVAKEMGCARRLDLLDCAGFSVLSRRVMAYIHCPGRAVNTITGKF